MSEARTLNSGDIDNIEARLRSCVSRGRPYTMSWGEIKSLVLTIRSLMDWQADVQEREASVCPEDVPFDEHIRYLQRRVGELEQKRNEQPKPL